MKKILGFSLVCCLLLAFAGCNQGNAEMSSEDSSSSSSSSIVEETLGSEGLAYLKKTDGSYQVVGVGTCTDTEIVIPSAYQGAPVVEIAGEAFAFNDTVTCVKIPKSVTSINPNAFSYCVNLAKVVFEDKSGWIAKEIDTVVTGTNLDLNDEAQAATLLKDTYVAYYWRKA